ncbi:MAG TPA: RidA family protein [Rudaea sp.]|jgi:enamine deaminase RidA (YjgF/YER057c/UK114 family)|nr:RidA family protein [Rudaea sp.]
MFRPIALLCLSLLLGACATTRVSDAPKSCYHLNAAMETDIGYCQAVRSGNLLYVSGSVGQGDMPAAMHMSYDRLKKVLAANGLDFRNVVKENVYATDLDAFIKNKDIRKDYYGTELPAATWVQVQRLFLPAFVVEVELVAEFPK